MLRKAFSRVVSVGGLGGQLRAAGGGVPQELDGELSLVVRDVENDECCTEVRGIFCGITFSSEGLTSEIEGVDGMDKSEGTGTEAVEGDGSTGLLLFASAYFFFWRSTTFFSAFFACFSSALFTFLRSLTFSFKALTVS